jgi:hypothetical protein
VTTLNLLGGLLDLVWTMRDNIVYTATAAKSSFDPMSSEVVTISLTGSVIARIVSTSTYCFTAVSVSTDGAIYMIVSNHIQQSNIIAEICLLELVDEGVTWIIVFRLPADKHYLLEVTKVSPDPQHIVFWTRVTAHKSREQKLEKHGVRVYTVIKRQDAGMEDTNVTWRDVCSTNMVGDVIYLPRLMYDDHSIVFTTNCRDVYAWSVSDKSELLLIEASDGNSFVSVSMDRQRNVLYAGKGNGSVISVYNLTCV